jgi:VanZ family protein
MQLFFYRSFFILIVVLVYLLAITPSSGSPPSIPYLDKILHFLIFFLLTFILDFCTRKPLREHFCLILLLIGFGVFIEVSQYFTTTRSAEFLDGLCDFLGVLVYLLFAPNISIGLKK